MPVADRCRMETVDRCYVMPVSMETAPCFGAEGLASDPNWMKMSRKVAGVCLSEQLSIAAGRSPPSAIGQSLHDRRHNRRIHGTADAQTRPRRKHDLNDARWHRRERRRVGRDLEG